MATTVDHKWSADPRFTLEETEIHLPDETWDIDPPSEVPAYHKRRSAGLWTAIATLAVGLAAVAVYGYSVISQNNAQLAFLPGLTRSISSVRTQLNGLESRMQVWQQGQSNLAAKVQKLNAGWKTGLNDTRLYSAQLVKDAYQRQHIELNQRAAMLSAQLAQMTAHQQSEQLRVAQLEKELANTRQELVSVRDSYSRQLAALRGGQMDNQRDIASINNVLSTDQVDFEIEKNHEQELVPGVSLHLTKTDIRHQRYQGWLWLAANRRTIWVRGQGIQRPVVFYPTPGGEAYELVITRVNQKDATGYLLIPGGSATQQAALASR